MKRVILAAVCIVAFSGFAAAQSSAKQATKPGKATVKKSVPAKNNTTAHTVLRHDDSATAKSDSTIKLVLPAPKIPDTMALPTVKKDEEL